MIPISNSLRRQILPVAVFGLSLGVAIYCARTVSAGAYPEVVRFFGGAFLAGLCLLILRRWRMGVVCFFVWVNFEDLLRKYMGNDLTIYFVKDILVLVTYLSYFRGGLPSLRRDFGKWLTTPIVIWFLWALIGWANSSLPSILVPVLGTRMSFFYIPMLFLGYAFFKSEQQFRRFLVLILSIAAVVSALGITQSVVGLEFMNPEAGPYLRLDLVRGEMGAEVPRPTSTFVDSSRLAHYLFAMTYLGLGFLGYLYASKQPKQTLVRAWTWLCWLTVFLGLYVCGVRAAVLWFVLSIPLLTLGYVYGIRRRLSSVQTLPVKRILLAGGLSLVVLGLMFPKRFEAALRYYSTTLVPTSSQSEYGERSSSHWGQLATALQSSPVLGHGTGSASLGIQYLMGKYVKVDPMVQIYNVEGGFACVVWEWGVIGLMLWLWWTGALVFKLFQSARTLRDTPFYWQGVTVCVYAFFILFAWFLLSMGVYQDFVVQAVLWFLTGFIFRAAGLARTTRIPEPARCI